MVTLHFTSTVILIGTYITINIKQSSASSSPPESSFSELQNTCQNTSGVDDPNELKIHMTVETTITSSNLKNIIRNDSSKNMNSSTTESTDPEFNITPRSAKEENLGEKLQTIEKTLKDLQAENKRLRTSVEKKSIGVHCSTERKKSGTGYPKNCKEILRNGNNVTGIYEIYPKGSKGPIPVLCDMDIRGGGWTHIQKRFDGSEDFNRDWRDYKFGFGDLEGEFWLGLQNIHLLTGFETAELLVEVTLRDGKSAYAHYSSFGVGPETTAYKLERLSGFSGDAGDSLTHHFGQKFSTRDLDFTKSSCATKHRGGWWFVNCLWSNLNANVINIDLPLEQFYYIGVYWYTYKDENCLSAARMLVRPVN